MKLYALAEVKAVEDVDGDPNGSFDVILSAPTLDRDGEVIDAKAFEPLPDHITFDIDHGMSTATTVGSGVPSYDDEGRLRVRGTYSSIPRAQEVRTLVREGHIRTTSVAFMSAQREQKDGVTHITRAELLNGAFVPIPSNRQAVVLSAKAYGEAVKAGARNSTKDAERLQSIHDLAVENGAACAASTDPKSFRTVVRKGHGLSASNLRTILQSAVSEAHPRSAWPWVRDYSDEWVVFELYDDTDTPVVYRQTYSVDGNAAALTGDPVEVVALVDYQPKSSTDAPATPADEAGKSPASEVGGFVRSRVAVLTESLAQ